MTRISTFSQNQTLLNSLLNGQRRLFESQRQATEFKVASEFRGIADQASTLLGAKSLRSRSDSYVDVGREVERTINTYDVQLTTVVDSARDLRQTIVETLSLNERQDFTQLVEGTFSLVTSALNTNFGGRYLFSGSLTDTKSITVESLEDLVALDDVSEAFANDDLKATARISDSQDITYGLLADEVVGDLFASLKRIGEFNAGPDGPISGALTDAQRAFLDNELVQLDAAIQTAQNAQITNGLNSNRVETTRSAQSDQRDFLDVFVADIEDVNPAEAISRLERDRVALEVSYRAVANISRLSLADFI